MPISMKKQLQNAIDDLGFHNQTPIQEETYSKILAGKDLVGIAQTGTGKTIAYCLPLLQELSYSKQNNPRILILVPTRELVAQVVETLEQLTKYITCRVVGVYGGTNMNTQKKWLENGAGKTNPNRNGRKMVPEASRPNNMVGKWSRVIIWAVSRAMIRNNPLNNTVGRLARCWLPIEAH